MASTSTQQVRFAEAGDADQRHWLDQVGPEPSRRPGHAGAEGRNLVRRPVHEVEGHLGDVVEGAADGVERGAHVDVRLLDLRGEITGPDGGAVGRRATWPAR